MRVKRALARDPFTLREQMGTGQPQSVDKRAARVRYGWVEFGAVQTLLSDGSPAFGNRRRH